MNYQDSYGLIRKRFVEDIEKTEQYNEKVLDDFYR